VELMTADERGIPVLHRAAALAALSRIHKTVAVAGSHGKTTTAAMLALILRAAGWSPIYAHVSEEGEWDDYEWSWVGSLTQWALDNPSHPDAGDALAAAREHRAGWLGGYRGTLGFACLLLRPTRTR